MSSSNSFTPKKIIKILERNGFVFIRSKGSHHIYKNVATGKWTIVPMHNKDLPKGTFHNILKQAGLDKEIL